MSKDLIREIAEKQARTHMLSEQIFQIVGKGRTDASLAQICAANPDNDLVKALAELNADIKATAGKIDPSFAHIRNY